jgi:hypothetical protein
VFLGYSLDHKGYRCYNLTSCRVLISRHVVFDESDFPFSSSTPTLDPDVESMFSDLVVQPPVSVFPFPAGSSGTPPPLAPTAVPELPLAPLAVPFVAPDVGLVPSAAPRVPPAPLATPHVPPAPSPRHTRLRRLLPCHARPRPHLHATPSPCRCTSAVRCLHRCYLLRILHQRCP